MSMLISRAAHHAACLIGSAKHLRALMQGSAFGQGSVWGLSDMQRQTPDRLTAEKGDPNAKHPGRSWNVHRNERPWVAYLVYP